MAQVSQTAFFSYSRDDSEFAIRLAEDLKAAGANVWMDQLDIEPGMPWDRAVEVAVTRCPHMLVILSPTSVNSDNVRDEISFALSKRKRVIPVLYRECDVPFRLARLQHIDFRSDYGRGLKKLLKLLSVEQQSVADRGAEVPSVPRESLTGVSDGDERKRTIEETLEQAKREQLKQINQAQAGRDRPQELKEARQKGAEQEVAERNKLEEKPSSSNYDPSYYSTQSIARKPREEEEQTNGGTTIETEVVVDSIAKGVVVPTVCAAVAWAWSFVIWIMIYSAAVDNELNISWTNATLAWIAFILIGGAGCSGVYQLNRGVPKEALFFGGALSGSFLALVLFIGSFEVSDTITDILKLGLVGGGLGWLCGRALQEMVLQIDSHHCKRIACVWSASWAVSWAGFSISLVSLNGTDFPAWKRHVKSYLFYPLDSLHGFYPLLFAWGMIMSAACTGIIFWCLPRVTRERLPADDPVVTLKLNLP